MDESLIRFPITCPRCGLESLTKFRAVVVTIATVEWHSMRLYAPCHQVFWDASDLELEQIGAYLGAAWIGAVRAQPDSEARLRRSAHAL
jgi:hypothetical protein